jgi:oxygen-independent coproporphyrinogen-3 oxidase
MERKLVANSRHLYIHIPFCKNICTYCDFVRFKNCENKIDSYLKKIIKDIDTQVSAKTLDSIYIGGGTPNCLTIPQLKLLLKKCAQFIHKKTEFTIECNPEFVSHAQAKLFQSCGVNRISLGAQTTNNLILKKYGRKHTVQDLVTAIKILQKNKLTNLSLDFIYGFNELTNKDLQKSIDFIEEHKIPHVSFYALELKAKAIITHNSYQINELQSDTQLAYIIKHLDAKKYHRYEVSN